MSDYGKASLMHSGSTDSHRHNNNNNNNHKNIINNNNNDINDNNDINNKNNNINNINNEDNNNNNINNNNNNNNNINNNNNKNIDNEDNNNASIDNQPRPSRSTEHHAAATAAIVDNEAGRTDAPRRRASMHEMAAQTSKPHSRKSSITPNSALTPATARSSGSRVSPLSLVIHGVLRFLKDLMTFLVRGGLSSLLFLMDQTLSALLTVTHFVPGGAYISGALRSVMWVVQVLIWVVYTSCEMVLYLPVSVLVLYVVFLAAVYSYLPASVQHVLSFIVWAAQTFLHFLKDVVYGYASYDRNENDTK